MMASKNNEVNLIKEMTGLCSKKKFEAQKKEPGDEWTSHMHNSVALIKGKQPSS